MCLQQPSPSNSFTEVCYDVQYPEENRRKSGDPWSIRRTALYYQYDTLRDTSVSFLIQPSARLRAKIFSLLASDTAIKDRSILIQHAVFVSSGLSWKEYVVSLESDLSILEDKAFFSKVGIPSQHDYSLMFKDYQNLKRLRKKVMKVQCILEANIEVVTQYRGIDLQLLQRQCELTFDPLDWYLTQLITSHRHLSWLSRLADDVGETLLYILKHRNEEATQFMTKAIRDSGHTLTGLVALSNQGAEALSSLTLKTQKDSRTTRILTLVASLYLPASLVATIFSSNLIESIGSQDNNSNTYFAAAHGFWMFPLFSVVLMICTLLPIWLYVRWTRSD